MTSDRPTDLVFEDRWSRLRRLDQDASVYESKFATGEVSISARNLEREWERWTEQEKLSFAKAFAFKRAFLPEDHRILDFLMERGSDAVAVIIANLVLRHPDRHKVKLFLLKGLRSSSEPKTNFMQALSMVGGSDVVHALQEFHDRALDQMRTTGQKQDRVFLLEFIYSCSVLRRLENNVSYEDQIAPFQDNEDEIVRRTACRLLSEKPI